MVQHCNYIVPLSASFKPVKEQIP